MNLERDSDRRLRSWLAEGLDRAPERFVWAALDDIERLPQSTPRRTALDNLTRRLRPVAVLAGAAAALVVGVAIVLRLAGPNLGIGPGSRDVALADLPGIVLWEDTMPSTWTLDNLVSNPDEVRRTPIRSMTEAELLALQAPEGYLGGRYTDFSGPDAAYISWAVLFENESSAAAALPSYRSEMASPDAWGLGQPELVSLGDEGYLYTGETTALLGPPTGVDPVPARIYLWRHGNLLLALGGWFDVDAAELRSVAEGIDARADAIRAGAANP